ncbi:Fatty acyl-CoA reductase [Sergentomyia squamirostris]
MTSNIAEFYRGKNLFITGGTGFLGIALIEKLLRSCPDVGRIYLLMRQKKGKSIEQRLEELTKNAIFETLLEKSSPDVFKKLIPVTGDVGDENLGLSPADRQVLIDNVNVVFHSAATLDFQAALKPTVTINLLGTRRVMELCQQIRNMKAMVHVSSAYVNSFLLETHEKLYPAPEIAEKVIDIAQTLSDEAVDELTPTLLKDHPNTYTFTKHLAEHEVNQCASRFPCGIVRPSMITAAWKEPVPGWTISKNGPQGFLMGASKGVIRRLPVGLDLIYDYIPVDIVVNQIIVVAAEIATKATREVSIYHCTSSTYNPFRWSNVAKKVNGYLHKYPLKSAVWYPHLRFVQSLLLFKISAIFIHFLPAYILDGITKIAGGRPILVRLHTNVWESLNRLEKFIFTEWKFHNTRSLELSKSLSAIDKEHFYIDIVTLVWEDYFVHLTQGVRRYLNNEQPKSLHQARKKDTILLFVHLGLQLVIHCGVWWFVSSLVGWPMTKCPFIVPLSYVLMGLL